METTIIFLVTAILSALGVLIFLANTGSVAAAYTLGILTAVILQAVHGLFELARSRAQAAKEQAAFSANAQENLEMMQAMQTIQNRQNQTIMSQLQTTARLPQPQISSGLLSVDDGIFEELE